MADWVNPGRTARMRAVAVGASLVWLAAGCATSRIENVPLTHYQPGHGYGEKIRATPNAAKLHIVLAFSGGGTRAAALSYGVLRELRDTQVEIDGRPARLLDEVTEISSVSGGSFTAAYFGLHGDGIFEDYEERFLRKDIQGELIVNLLRPLEWLRMLFTPTTRSDRAAEIYDREVFDGATFADLQAAGGPALNINATDLGESAVFTFVQPRFDPICSDLSKMRVAVAVTASSAVPGAFAPLLLENRAGSCGYAPPSWFADALEDPTANRRRYHDARIAASYLDAKKRPYIHLVDGGIADNIGARRILGNVQLEGGVEQYARDHEFDVPEHVLYVIVNAQASGEHPWRNKPNVPSLISVLGAISGVGIYRYNFETIELLRESVVQWSAELAKQGTQITPYVVEVAFDNLKDPTERAFFESVKTSFDLDDATVDRLIDVAGRLMRETPEFQQFLADFGGALPRDR